MQGEIPGFCVVWGRIYKYSWDPHGIVKLEANFAPIPRSGVGCVRVPTFMGVQIRSLDPTKQGNVYMALTTT